MPLPYRDVAKIMLELFWELIEIHNRTGIMKQL